MAQLLRTTDYPTPPDLTAQAQRRERVWSTTAGIPGTPTVAMVVVERPRWSGRCQVGHVRAVTRAARSDSWWSVLVDARISP